MDGVLLAMPLALDRGDFAPRLVVRVDPMHQSPTPQTTNRH